MLHSTYISIRAMVTERDQNDPETEGNTTVKYVTKAEWGGVPAKKKQPDLRLPIPQVVILHTAEDPCFDLVSCSSMVKSIQYYHQEICNYDDIGYNFLAGGDGRIYIGMGWKKEGAHTISQNNKSIGISFMGNFMKDQPTEKQLQAVQMLIEHGVNISILSKNYKLYAHKQFTPTESPGTNVYDKIIHWPHFELEIHN